MQKNPGYLLTLAMAMCLQTTMPAIAKNSPPTPAPAKLRAVVLDQSDDIYGKTQTTISDTGVRIQIVNTNAVLIAKAPTWQVMFYNKLSKKCMSMPMDKYLHHIQYTTYQGREWDRTTLALSHPSDTERFGRKAVNYRIAGSKRPGGVAFNAKVANADYVDIENLPGSPEAIQIMQKCLSTPYSKGIPLELVNHAPTKKAEAFRTNTTGDQTFLRTQKLDEIQVLPSTFDYPKSFIAETSEVGIINDAQRQSQVNTAFETFLH